MERIKEVWPKWEGLEILGEGGFGIVYKAKKDSFAGEEFSAIKIVKIPHNESEHDEMMSSGFSNENIKEYYHKSVMNLVDEIKMMQKMKAASHVVSIEDYEVVENSDGIGYTIFIRMELLTNITKYFREKEITVQEAVKMATHILTALEFCHDQNIMHRDIKPANIFISEFKEYKLGDFGVSREVERTNATMSQKGTKSYMAPEMVRMEKYGKNIDIYALGLTMYELLNHGRMPFLPPFPEMFLPSDREEANYKRLSGEEFPDIKGIGELNAIIKKACHPLKEKRYQSAKEMKNDLMKLNVDEDINKEEILVQDDFLEEKTAGLFDNDILSNNESNIDISEDKTLNVFNENTFLFKDDKTVAFESKKEVTSHMSSKPIGNSCPICGSEMEMLLNGIKECSKCDYIFCEKDDIKTKKTYEYYKNVIKNSNDLNLIGSIMRDLYEIKCLYFFKPYKLIEVIDKRKLGVKAFDSVLTKIKNEKSKNPELFASLVLWDNHNDVLKDLSNFSITSAVYGMQFRYDKMVMEFKPRNEDSKIIFGRIGLYLKDKDKRTVDINYFELYDVDFQTNLSESYLIFYKKKYELKLNSSEASTLKYIIKTIKETLLLE